MHIYLLGNEEERRGMARDGERVGRSLRERRMGVRRAGEGPRREGVGRGGEERAGK